MASPAKGNAIVYVESPILVDIPTVQMVRSEVTTAPIRANCTRKPILLEYSLAPFPVVRLPSVVEPFLRGCAFVPLVITRPTVATRVSLDRKMSRAPIHFIPTIASTKPYHALAATTIRWRNRNQRAGPFARQVRQVCASLANRVARCAHILERNTSHRFTYWASHIDADVTPRRKFMHLNFELCKIVRIHITE